MNQLIAKAPYNTQSTKILIKAGSGYEGTLKVVRIPDVKYSNTEMEPLIIDVYGVTTDTPYAKITGPENGSCVEVDGSNIRISGLEVTGATAYRGIWLNPKKAGIMKNVVISGNYCHDINFNTTELTADQYAPETPPSTELAEQICSSSADNKRYDYLYGGIIANAPSNSNGACWFEDLWIENNRVERVARTGIWVFSNWVYRPGVDWGVNKYVDDNTYYYPHKNVIIRRNGLSQTGGDAIVMGAVWGGWIENNTAYYSQYLGRYGYFNAGIWTHSCKDVVFQFNEAAYTYKRNNAGDGQGFDIDIGNTNITFRYNYSHHNEGGGILFINNPTKMIYYNAEGTKKETIDAVAPDWSDVAVRNNVFVDNGGATFDVRGKGNVRNLTIENNTVVIRGRSDSELLLDTVEYGGKGADDNWMFRNNIFLSRGDNGAKLNTTNASGARFYSNVFWGFPSGFESTILTNSTGNEIDRIYVSDPGIDRTQDAQNGLDSMLLYKPRSSAMLTGADALTEREPYDAAGMKVGNRWYFGAFGSVSAQ